jgi:hypothetical protein
MLLNEVGKCNLLVAHNLTARNNLSYMVEIRTIYKHFRLGRLWR